MATSSARSILVLRWIARILGTIIAVFTLTRFAVEILEPGGLNIENVQHWVLLIPMWIAQIGLLLGWRWERFGGMLASACLIFLGIASLIILRNPAVLIMSVFMLIPAVLYIYCWQATKKRDLMAPAETPEVHHEPA